MSEKARNYIYFICFTEVPFIISVIFLYLKIQPHIYLPFMINGLINSIFILSFKCDNPIRINYLMMNFCVVILYLSYIFGFMSGYSLYLLDVPIVMILIEYVLKKKNARKISAVPACIVALICFIGSYDISRFIVPVYKSHIGIDFWVFRINVIIAFLMTSFAVLSLKRKAEMYEEKQIDNSNIDLLTGLKNRRALLSIIDYHLQNRRKVEDLSCAILDIDDFKKFNDTYGHYAGDAVLRDLGNDLKQIEDDNDFFVGRWGGEEFVILSLCPNGDKRIHDLLQDLLNNKNKNPVEYKKQSLFYTFTAGITKYREHDTIDNLINRADTCLYVGKKHGKNRIEEI